MGHYDILSQLGSGLSSVLIAVTTSTAPLLHGTAQPWTVHDRSTKRLLVTPLQQVSNQQQVAVPVARLMTKPATSAPTIDCRLSNCVALTFDDGPNPLTTPQIINELEQYHVPATFFVVGSRVAGNGPLLRRMQADGFEIGNHTWGHPDVTKLPDDQVLQQVRQTQAAITAVGVPAPKIFRPPYGAIDQRTEADIKMPILLWNEDPKDWAANTPDKVVQAVEAAAKPGGVVDLHDIYHVTANALPQIITDLQACGFHFVTVSQLLNLTSGSQGVFYGR